MNIKKLKDWVYVFMGPTKVKAMNYNVSSYGIKHVAEQMLGEYVSNVEMKIAMETYFKEKHYVGDRYEFPTEAARNSPTVNMCYNISSSKYSQVKMLAIRMKATNMRVEI